MSTMPTPPERTFRQRWLEFWFAPGDPTTLGFIRIATGLLVLYTHLAYSLDLQAFFGRYGWYASEYMERERKEYPRHFNSFVRWDDAEDVLMRVPEAPHRRAPVIRFIRDLPDSAAERARAVKFLDRATQEDNATSMASINLMLRLYGAGESQRETLLRDGLERGRQFYAAKKGPPEFRDKQPDDANWDTIFPEVMLAKPENDRLTLAADIRAFLGIMPKTADDAQILVLHLLELDPLSRRKFAKFVSTLPDDAAERQRLIDYLDYWNNDVRDLNRTGHPIFSVWFHVTHPTQMALVHGLALTVMVLFTIGFCTRLTAVLTWIAVVGYVHRTNQILFGMDTMMNILIIYLMIGNSGAALSVDRLIARYRAVRASLRRGNTIDEPTRAFLAQAPPSTGANLGIRLIQVHFCFIYLASGFSKLKGPGWWSGTAFWDVMVNPEFTMMRYHWFEEFIRAIASIKPLYYAITAFGVWFTWGLEISFPFLVWTRLRPVMLWLAVLLHASIGILMGLNLFELLMMTMLLVYLPPGVIRDRLRGGTGLPKLTYEFDPADAKQTRAVATVAALDVDAQVAAVAGKGRDLPAVATAEGTKGRGSDAVATLAGKLRLLGLLRVFLVIPGAGTLLSRWLCPSPVAVAAPKPGPPTPAAAS